MSVPNYGDAVAAHVILTAFGAVGGYLVKFLHGHTFPKVCCFPGYTIKPCITKFEIPTILGMILFGFIARNYFGDLLDAFPDKWAEYIRSLTLAGLQLRGGFDIEIATTYSAILFVAMLP